MRIPLLQFLKKLVYVSPMLLIGCFGSPVRGVWPPVPNEPRHPIDVLVHSGHSVIFQKLTEPAPARWESWEYCEIEWYLRNGNRGMMGAVRAMLYPSKSAVGYEVANHPLWDEMLPDEYKLYTYELSSEGLKNLKAFLEGQQKEDVPDEPGWRFGTQSYCLLHDCHHFTAYALRAAGLPIRPWWAFTGGLLNIQLKRCAKYRVN